ncbi:MAG TPA: type II toxin-antitoxin system HicB family antitoxin [Segetibacter sp.]|jgi:predicted HicB family RNase H-like nuclease
MSENLEYKGYNATVSFNAEEDFFYGKVLGINDLVSFEGETAKELKQAFYEAVDDYLETCEAVGKEPNKAYKGVFNVRIPSELHRKAAIVAATKNVTLNDLVKTAIDTLLKNTKNEDLALH